MSQKRSVGTLTRKANRGRESRSLGDPQPEITDVTSKTVNLLAAPIFSLFFFALFVRRSSALSAWIGTLSGVATAAVIAFSGPLVYWLHTQFQVDPGVFNVQLITDVNPATGQEYTTCEDAVSFQWIGPASLLVRMVVGWLASLVFPRRGS